MAGGAAPSIRPAPLALEATAPDLLPCVLLLLLLSTFKASFRPLFDDLEAMNSEPILVGKKAVQADLELEEGAVAEDGASMTEKSPVGAQRAAIAAIAIIAREILQIEWEQTLEHQKMVAIERREPMWTEIIYTLRLHPRTSSSTPESLSLTPIAD